MERQRDGAEDPAPIVYYDEADSSWGAGEISFVELDGTLYCYYTWSCNHGDFCMVSTADSANENWPATMEYRGRAFTKAGDQVDVVYVEDNGMSLLFQPQTDLRKRAAYR